MVLVILYLKKITRIEKSLKIVIFKMIRFNIQTLMLIDLLYFPDNLAKTFQLDWVHTKTSVLETYAHDLYVKRSQQTPVFEQLLLSRGGSFRSWSHDEGSQLLVGVQLEFTVQFFLSSFWLLSTALKRSATSDCSKVWGLTTKHCNRMVTSHPKLIPLMYLT